MGIERSDGMGFIFSRSKKLRNLRRGVLSRKNVSMGARGGAAFMTGGQSEVYRMKSRAITGGQYNPMQRFGGYQNSPSEGLMGIESLGEVQEGMGRRRFGGIKRMASRAVKKVASAPKIAKKLANVNTMLKVSTGGLVDKDALKDITGGVTDFAKGFMSKGGGGGGAESEAPAEKIMASSQGGVFSWGSGGGGGGSSFTEEVQETNPETGKVETVTKMKPTLKYGLIGLGGLAALALILKLKK